MRESNARLNERLTAMENLHRMAQPYAQSTPTRPQVEGWEPPIAQPTTTTEPIIKPAKPKEWEQILGGNWLARIGVLALIIGVAFFIKLAFDNNWIGPMVRIILGTATGLGLLAGGYFWRTRYPVLSQTISGGLNAVLYISFFAAFAAFQMIPFYLVVILLFLVSGVSAALAIRYNSMGLAIFGIIGAFIAPPSF